MPDRSGADWYDGDGRKQPDYDGDEWQRGFWSGYRLGVVRGRIQAWIIANTAKAKP